MKVKVHKVPANLTKATTQLSAAVQESEIFFLEFQIGNSKKNGINKFT